MKNQLLINEISLALATLFLIIACFSKNLWYGIIGLAAIIYSVARIKKLKEK